MAELGTDDIASYRESWFAAIARNTIRPVSGDTGGLKMASYATDTRPDRNNTRLNSSFSGRSMTR